MNPIALQIPEHTSPSGYAEFGVNLACELYRRGLDLQYAPVWWDHAYMPPGERKERILIDILRQGQGLDPRTIIYLQLPDQPQPEPSKTNVIFTMFETDGLPLDWVNRLNSPMFDQVWVPSGFNLRTFGRSGVRSDKIRVVPLGIDLEELKAPFKSRALTRQALTSKLPGARAIFMASMQAAPRKNLEALLIPFLRQFKGREDVALVLKVHGIKDLPTKIGFTRKDQIEGDPLPRILVCDQILPLQRVHELLFACDAYLSMSHGEGADLMALKALSQGMPVAVPDWGGYLEYMVEAPDMTIPILQFTDAGNPGIVTDHYYQGQLWSEPSHAQYAKKLDDLATFLLDGKPADHPLNAQIRDTQTIVINNHSISSSAESLLDHLREIENLRSGPPRVAHFPDSAAGVPRPVMCIPSPALPCGIWDASAALAGGMSELMISRDPFDAFQMIENHSLNLFHLQLEYGFVHPHRLRLLLGEATRRGVRTVVTMHSYAPGVPHNKVIAELADGVIFHNDEALDLFDQVEGKDSRIFTTLIPLPTQEAVPTRSISRKDRTILASFGFSFRHKGHREFCLALKELRRIRPNVYGILAASVHPTPNASTLILENWLRESGCSDFVTLIHQFLADKALFSSLAHADLIVLPYRDTPWWGSSQAFRTVARLGKPIVTTGGKFFRDVGFASITLPDGVLDEPRAFAESLHQILEDQESQQEAKDQLSTLHSAEDCARMTRGFYRSVLGMKQEEVTR